MGKDAYVDEYRQRIMELNEQRIDLWEVVRKYENQPVVQIGSSQGDSCSYKIYFAII